MSMSLRAIVISYSVSSIDIFSSYIDIWLFWPITMIMINLITIIVMIGIMIMIMVIVMIIVMEVDLGAHLSSWSFLM